MTQQFPPSLGAYAAAREALLSRIHAGLEADPRFAAAWLGGSYGRGEQDAVSDLDLFVVVSDEYASALCRRQAAVAAGSIPERLELFGAFGEPASIHENHHNAPPGGSFSAVLYHQPPVIVDWVLLPRTGAARPPDTRLLFDRAGIPGRAGAGAPAPGNQEARSQKRAEIIAERAAFFAMMAAVTAKYIVRGGSESAQELLLFTGSIVHELETLAGQPGSKPGEAAAPDRLAQSDRLRRWIGQVEELARLFEQREEASLPIPREEIEAILDLRG